MKIAFIALPVSPFADFGKGKAGGGQVTLYNLITHLPKTYTIDVYTGSDSNPHNLEQLSSNITVKEIFKTKKTHQENTNYILNNINKFTSEILIPDYDLIHTNYWLSGALGLSIIEKKHIPFIQSFWTLEKIKQTYLPNYKVNPERISIEEQVIQKANLVIANTHLEKADLIKEYQADDKKISIIPPGICPSIFEIKDKKESLTKLGLSNKYKYLLFVGRMDPIKGLPVLIDAMCEVHEKFPNIRLIITGGSSYNDYYQYIATDIQSCKLSEVVILKEAQPHTLLPYFYSIADITIMPSHHESFGLVALESMACKTPVIASKVGGLQTFIRNNENSILIEDINPTKIVTTISKLLTDESLYKEVRNNGYTTSKKYSWKSIVTDYVHLYQSLTTM